MPASVNGQALGQPVAPALPEMPPEGPPLTPVGWFKQNFPYIVFFIVIIAVIYHFLGGWEGVGRAGLVVVGLGLVVFIHELGHFVAAKMCDVHVVTFSLGFGPALPGCSFRRGETTYMIGILPLGGYVQMIGEGFEDENAAETDPTASPDYPRSFKNKSVGARMIIISAGVIMNLILGAICFVTVYRGHGIERQPAVVSAVDPGSPAWRASVRSGSIVEELGGIKNPFFDDLKLTVALSSENQKIPFRFRFGKNVETIDLVPYKDVNNPMPIIGVSGTTNTLALAPRRLAKEHALPVGYGSAAAAARVLDLKPGDLVIAATDPKDDKLTPVDGSTPGERLRDVCNRLRDLGDRPMVLKVRRAATGVEESIEVAAEGFDFDDHFVATTDPTKRDDPYQLVELPKAADELQTSAHSDVRDSFEFRRRMRLLAGWPAVVRVKRGDDMVLLLVPPAYHRTVGLRMHIGTVAAVRGPAADKVQPGDKIDSVRLSINDGKTWIDEPFREFDPTRLPDLLAGQVAGVADKSNVRVELTVTREPADKNGQEKKTEKKLELKWDDSFTDNVEIPISQSSPMSIPQLGIAYHVQSWVKAVDDPSLCQSTKEGETLDAKDKIAANDTIVEIRYQSPGKTATKPGDWGKFAKMKSKRGKEEVYDRWAFHFLRMQDLETDQVQVKFTRGDGKDERTVALKLSEDRSWPIADRGFHYFKPAMKLQQADTIGEALWFGYDRTVYYIKSIYAQVGSLISRRVDAEVLGGPIEIAAQTFAATESWWTLVFFLGLLSVNLAVLNFLPIPVLDGGHMVFLIYEKIRGKPPTEFVRKWATLLGFAAILSLMAFVFYNDIMKWFVR
jgi:regulator of sigma E protease